MSNRILAHGNLARVVLAVFAVSACACAGGAAQKPVQAASEPARTPQKREAQAVAAPETAAPASAPDLAPAVAKERAWDYAGAEQAYQTIVSADPANVAATLGLARVSVLQGKADAAERVLLQLRKTVGDKAEVLGALSTAARAQKKFSAAIDYAKRILLRDQGNVQALTLVATASIEQGKYDSAELYLQAALGRMPKSSPLLGALGYLYWKRGDPMRAMLQLKRALDADPNNAIARQNAGFLALAYRDYPLAKTHLEAAVALGQAGREVSAARCFALEGTHEGEPAAACFSELIAKGGAQEGDLAGYLLSLGMVHQNLTRKPKAALEALRKYVELKGATLPKNDRVFGMIKKLEASDEAKPQATSPGSRAEPLKRASDGGAT